MKKFISSFATAGIILPLILLSISVSIPNLPVIFDKFKLALWPSSSQLPVIYAWSLNDVAILVISIAINVLIYSTIGLFFWLGLHKNRLIFLILIPSIFLLEYKWLLFNFGPRLFIN